MCDAPYETVTVEPLTSHDIECMIHILEKLGWRRWRGKQTVWASPNGLLFRGPAEAFSIALQHQ